MDLKELKAKAYDLICSLESHNAEMQKIKKQLDQVNGEIYKLVKVDDEELST